MRRILALTLAVGLVLTACSGGDGGAEVAADVTTAAGGDEESLDRGTGGGEATAAAQVEVALEVVDDRQVIRRASLELQASDTRETFDQITAMVESAGGFVANADVFPTSGDEQQPQVAMTLRVPVDQLNETISAIKDTVDEVVAESQAAEDVTEQFIDLEARLTNLEALETELRALLTEVRMQNDADPEKILTVFNELSSVRGQIEEAQGRLDYLEDATALATLEIHLSPTPSAIPIVDEPWSPAETARDALRNLVTGLEGAADWAINLALYGLPMLLIILGPLAVIAVLVYRKWIRRPTEPNPAGS